jgi:hypothetical protein
MNDDELLQGLCGLDQKNSDAKAEFLMRSAHYLINELTVNEAVPFDKQVPDLIITYSFKKLIPLVLMIDQTNLLVVIDIINHHIEYLISQPTQSMNNGAIRNPCMALGAQLLNTLLAPLTLIKNKIESKEIKNSILAYKNYLLQKIRNESGNQHLDLIAFKISSTYSQKLAERYNLISQLTVNLENKDILNHQDKEEARDVLNICLNAEPSWSERPFLQKISDFFNTCFKTNYKTYIPSQEDKFIEDAQKTLNKSLNF